MRFDNLPIKRKIVGLILLVSVSVLLLVGAVMLAREFHNYRNGMAGKLSSMAEIIAANSSAVLVFDDPRLAQEILSGLRAEPEVAAAALYDQSGALFVRYPTNLAAELLPVTPPGEGAEFHSDHLALCKPVLQNRQRVGTLFLRADYSQMYNRMALYSILLGAVLTVSVGLALILSNFLERWISLPVLELATVAKAVSENRDYSVRAAKASGDELGSLTEAFNSMLAQIQANDDALREREERYALVVAGAEAAIWDWDILQRRVLYSPRWKAMRGLSENEVGDSEAEWTRGIHPDDLQRVMDAVQAHIEGRTPVFAEEYRVRHKDGSWLWIQDRGVARRDAGGRAVRMAGSETDIAERKRAEEALKVRARQQQVVVALGEMALRERDLRTLFDSACALVAQTLQIEFCKVLELLPGGDSLLLRAGVGWHEGLVGHATVSADLNSQAGYTLQSETPVVVTDLPREIRFNGPELLVQHGITSGMSCIIRRTDKTYWGVLGAHSTRRVTFHRDDVNFLIAVANILGDAIHRELSERSLRESEERFAKFMQNFPGLAWIKDAHGRYVFANEGAATVFQIPREELYGKTDDEVFPPQIAAQFKANDRGALAGNKGLQAVEELVHKDGSVHHSIVSKFPIPGPDGSLALVGGMAVDITERRLAEEALRRSELRYRSIFEGVAISLWEEDFSAVKVAIDELRLNGVTDFRQYFAEHPEFVERAERLITVRDVNDTSVRMFEARSKTELLGSLPDIFTPESRPVLIQELLAVADGRAYMQGEARLKTLRGTLISVLFTMTLPPGLEGYNRVFFSLLDISERKQIESLRARLATIVEYSQDAIISKTLLGIIQTWNRGAQRVFGYTADEVIGRSITIIIPPERLAEEEMILERQRLGESIENYETVRVRKDGTRIEVSLSISPLRSADGTIIGISKIARDITEKKCAERELERARDAAEEANRAKDDFLAALSHELRTPLMPIMFTISMLQHDHSLSSNIREGLSMVRRNIEIQSRMINDLLDLSRIRANRLELSFDVIDLHEIIGRALEVCRGHPKFPELTIVARLDARASHVRGDADRLQQVFWNLIQNAMKFTPPGGRITIESTNRDNLICASVADSGCGIESGLLSKIFEPFEQGGRKVKASLQGLGLGLAIARRIVAAHGGTLTAASDGKDLGAVFTLKLEVVPADTAGQPVLEPELANPVL